MDLKHLAGAALAALCATVAHAQYSYIPCTTALGAPGYCASLKQQLAAETLQTWGNSSQTVQQKFPQTVVAAFTDNRAIDAAFSTLTPVEIGQLANEMDYHSAGTPYYANWIIAADATLSAKNLRLLASAVGPWEIEAFLSFAPAAVRAQFYALPQPQAIPGTTYAAFLSGWWSPTPGVSTAHLPVVDYTFDLYLEYRLSGPSTQALALAQTARYVGAKIQNHDLLKVFAWGAIIWQVGTTFDPNLNDQASALLEWINAYSTWDAERYGVGYNGQPVSIKVNYPVDLLLIPPPDPGSTPDVPEIAPPSLDDLIWQGMYTCNPVGQLACVP